MLSLVRCSNAGHQTLSIMMYLVTGVEDFGYGERREYVAGVYTTKELAEQSQALYTKYFGGYTPQCTTITYYTEEVVVDALPLKPVKHEENMDDYGRDADEDDWYNEDPISPEDSSDFEDGRLDSWIENGELG